MLQKRIIPALQLIDESLVKAIQFNKYQYIGDPCNTVRIFNELEVDELCFLDIRASKENRPPNLKILSDIANECFMPLSYGGGITSFEQAKAIFEIGFEKIIINTAAITKPDLIKKISEHYGAQAVVASIDLKKTNSGYEAFICDGSKKIPTKALDYALQLEHEGAGEILMTSMDLEGTWTGLDTQAIHLFSGALKVPLIAHGGAGKPSDIQDAFQAGASAVALGSMLVFQKKGFGVLINKPY